MEYFSPLVFIYQLNNWIQKSYYAPGAEAGPKEAKGSDTDIISTFHSIIAFLPQYQDTVLEPNRLNSK